MIFQSVHYRKKVFEDVMGKSDDDLLKYWTELFPNLILQMSIAFIEYENEKRF